MVTAVIFDIDGTLVDSVDLHARAWQRALESFGKKVSFEEVRRQIGKGGDQLMPVFLSEKEMEQFDDELDRYRSELFKREYLPRVQGFPRVRQLFEGSGKTANASRWRHRPRATSWLRTRKSPVSTI